MAQYKNWKRGEAYINGQDLQTFNPPARERKELTPLKVKSNVTHGPFTLVRVYRTRTQYFAPLSVKFLGYIVTLDGWQWLTPKTLAAAKSLADCIANDYATSIVRASLSRVVDTQIAA